jgi:hypothetical protein
MWKADTIIEVRTLWSVKFSDETEITTEFHLILVAFLDEKSRIWNGRCGSTECPPGSPDDIPLIFSMWDTKIKCPCVLQAKEQILVECNNLTF